MKNILIIIIFPMLLINFLNAQGSISASNTGEGVNFGAYIGSRALTKYQVNTSIDGSPYLNDEFIVGTISTLKKSYPLRYNLINDEIEIKISKDSIFILNKKEINYLIKIGDNTYKSYKYNDRYNYFNPISNNKNINLLKRVTKNFIEAKKAINSYDKDRKAYYSSVKASNFIYLNAQNKVVELPKKNKRFIMLFDENQNKIKEYLKKEKLNIKTFSDAIKVINYIDSLY